MGIWHSVGFGISGLQNEVVVQLLSHVQLFATLWPVGSSFLTWDETTAPCIGSIES